MNTRIKYLYQKYIEDECTEAEREEFFSLLNNVTEDDSINQLLDQTWNQTIDDQSYKEEQANRILNEILTNHPKPIVKKINWYRYAAAAILILGVALFLYHAQPAKEKATHLVQHKISPGTNKAILTLANGAEINLNETANGNIAQQAGIVIKKTADGQLVYDATQSVPQTGETTNPLLLNTITTPKGGQYQINLPDGTKIWLNAASSLKYPAAFNGSERKVELTGEAYFEVAHNKAKPFRVKSTLNGIVQEIEVLGTHFNINAYSDEEAAKTTLLEGSVRVSSLREGTKPNALRNDGLVKSEILKPGQQATLNSQMMRVGEVDTEEVIAWKTGFFQFNEAALPHIMRQLSRWYNVDVIFEGKPSADLFHFKIPRNLSLTEVLKIFETNGINFKIEGRKLIVKS